MDALTASFVVFIILVAILLPGLVASLRGHRNAAAIWIMLITLGWTGIGWAIALIWAFTDNVKHHEYVA